MVKKSSVIILLFFGLLFVDCSQNKSESANSQNIANTQLNKLSRNTNCNYGKTFNLGFYSNGYDKLNADSLVVIQQRLTDYASIDLEILRQNGIDFMQWCLIMRMKDIKWGEKKKTALEFLKTYSENILDEKYFLNKENRNILSDTNGCGYRISDALYLPQNCYWVMLNLDKAFFSKSVGEKWGFLMKNEPYFNVMRQTLLRYIKPYYKDKNIQNLLEDIHQKYGKNPDYLKEDSLVKSLIDKYDFSRTKTQKEAWLMLLEKSKPKIKAAMSSETLDEWGANIDFITEIYDDTDIEIPLSMAEKENDLKIKYGLTYCCCGLLNQKFPKKADNRTLQRIDALVKIVQKSYPTLKTGQKWETDFLENTYNVLKNHYSK